MMVTIALVFVFVLGWVAHDLADDIFTNWRPRP